MVQKLKNLRKDGSSEGFTIIEVLIVLAIAGLILLIVFLAVPALQRNARNTTRKNEVAAILGAVNEWSNNNSGSLPTSAANQTAALANAKTQFYTGNVTWGTPSTTITNSQTTETALIVTSEKCNANGADAIAGSSRQLVVLYKVETGSGTGQFICQES